MLGLFILMNFSLYAQEVSEPTEEAVTAIDETTLVINNEAAAGANNQGVNVQAIGLSDLIRTIVVLLLVIGAIYAVMYILRKFSTNTIDGSSLIKVVGSKGLMKDASVHLLEVGNQVFLVGSGSSSVNLISEITDQETIDNIRLNLSNGSSSKKRAFSTIISGYLGSGRKKNIKDEIENTENFLRKQRDRLKDL
jgi:flagellar biosynthetic protein FliO